MFTESPRREEHIGECAFCEIRDGRREASKILETRKSLSIVSLEGHPLVIPKVHIVEPQENIEAATDAFKVATQLVPLVKKIYKSEGVNIVANVGTAAGQQIMHFHVHVLPRNQGDRKVRFGHHPIQERELLDGYASKVKQAYLNQYSSLPRK